jgi:carbonic anhydrase
MVKMTAFRWSVSATLFFAFFAGGKHPEPAAGLSPEQALMRLKSGNARFVTGQSVHPNQDELVRTNVAKGQKPFAIVVGCADSRVPPEIVFDAGVGDLFVLRVAGNLADNAVIGSIEYAVEHLGAKLLIVMGHERCGAVKATLDGAAADGHLGALLEAIRPAVAKARGNGGDELDLAVRINAKLVADDLRGSKPILEEKVKAKKLKVVAARYDLDSGVVEVLE